MSLPRGVVKDENTGAIFYVKNKRELAELSTADLQHRLRWIRAWLNPESGGITYCRSFVRNVAMAERRGLVAEIVRRLHEQHEQQ